ncbi:hypothetical protein D3C71_826580 [compost metagenome]
MSAQSKAVTQARPENLAEGRMYLEAMEGQKEQLRALLSVLVDAVEQLDVTPDVRTLLALAAHINEDHAHWYSLRRSLGFAIESGTKGVA